METTTRPTIWAETDPDTQLMLTARHGDTTGLSLLIEKHYPALVRFCYRKVRDSAAAEDLAQEVFLRVHRSRAKYQPTAKFTTWLYRIAANLTLNWLRDNGRERMHLSIGVSVPAGPALQVADTGIAPDERLMRADCATEVRRAVDALPERQRRAVVLHNFEELPGADVAAVLCCSHQAVRSMLCRGYSTLRSSLADFGAVAL